MQPMYSAVAVRSCPAHVNDSQVHLLMPHVARPKLSPVSHVCGQDGTLNKIHTLHSKFYF